MRTVLLVMAMQLAACGWFDGLASADVHAVAMGAHGVVTMQSSGDACLFRAFDASGSERWRYRSSCDGQVFQVGDVVVFNERWATRALDAQTGDPGWIRAWDEDPKLFHTESGALLVHSDREGTLYGLEPSTGDTVWSAPGRRGTVQVGPSTVVVDGRWHHATTGEAIRSDGIPDTATFFLDQGVVRGMDDSEWFRQWTCDDAGECHAIAGALEVITARTAFGDRVWFVQETPVAVYLFNDADVWRVPRVAGVSVASAPHIGRAEDRYRWVAGNVVDLEELRARDADLPADFRPRVARHDLVVFGGRSPDAAAVFDPHTGDVFVMAGVSQRGGAAVHNRHVAFAVGAGVWVFDVDRRRWTAFGSPGPEPSVMLSPDAPWTSLERYPVPSE